MSDLTEMNALKAPSSSEEGVGGGASQRKTLLRRAAIMRSNLTEPERRLWMALRDKRFKFFRALQQPNLIHVTDECLERWMMHRNHDWHIF